jgi:glycosyltransferase involved in cell wall biosynthesis
MASIANPPGSAGPQPARGLSLLVTIPALDEERTVGDVIRGIPRDLPGIARVDVVVVDDGSSDGTGAAAEAAGAVVLRHAAPRGVGAAFGSALRYAVDTGADLIVSIDADGQFDPADIPALIGPVLSGRADFASASRFADPALTPQMPGMKRWGNRWIARIVSRLTGQTFHDVSCGMRCYSRRAALGLNPIGRFTYTQEVFLNLAFKQMRIVEVPIAVRGEREFGQSRVAGNLWRYALNTSGIIFRCYRDYRPMLFFGSVAGALAVLGLSLLAFLGVHYLGTGTFSPHKWAGFSGAAVLTLGLFVFLMGLIGDMLNRHRIYLEELLYRERERTTRGERDV